ncbi:MAG: DUF368 domain-containing protein [bacterium]|nr:DUF368 domain-containing protein [bacterium]
MKNIILILKGAIFGIANIIPGVSGGTLALTMGVYEDLISSISNFFKKPKESLKFILPFIFGAALSILLMSKVISLCLDKFPFPTTLFFVGLIIGGIPLLTKKIKKTKPKGLNIFLFILTFALIIFMNFINSGTNSINLENLSIITYLLLALVGLIAAATMVIPGISGSFVLMLLGFYEPIVNTISNLTDFSHFFHNIAILIPFGIGIILGILLVSKLLEYLFKYHEVSTYYAILGFVISSVIVLIMNALSVKISLPHIIIGLILLAIATIIGYKLGDE